MNEIVCSLCSFSKTEDCYYKNGQGRIIPNCKNCIKIKNNKYYQNNKLQVSNRKKNYYSDNKEKILEHDKEYRTNNKEEISSKKKTYYQNNREECIKRSAKYRTHSSRNFYANHKNEPEYRIRKIVSSAISKALKKSDSSKNSQSCLKYLPYTIQQLKEHLEKQFEPWMTWQNWGNYKKETWNNNDISTWTWQIDHIIPHSIFQYSSMEDDSFNKCWALDNLRPLSAKLNNFDGANRTRHSLSRI